MRAVAQKSHSTHSNEFQIAAVCADQRMNGGLLMVRCSDKTRGQAVPFTASERRAPDHCCKTVQGRAQ